jgi:membrane fusion protein (multidrug efflux system)
MSEAQTPSRLPRIFLGLAGLLVAGGVLLSITAPSPGSREAAGVQPVRVRSHLIVPRQFQRVAELAGMLEARKRVELFAEAEGKITEVGAEELDRIDAGQLLLRMDPLLAEIDVSHAVANLARGRSELRLAVANLERQRSLRGNSVASEAAYDRAVNDEGVAKATLQEARALVERARDALRKKTMVAPFAGELRLFPVMVGEYVRTGERVGELLDVDKLRLTIGLTGGEIVAIAHGSIARVTVAARPGEMFEGTVRRVGGALDPDTRKFPLQIEIDNPEGRLLPGMVARVRLDFGTSDKRIAIPREALSIEYGVRSVFVLSQDDSGAWHSLRRRVEIREIPFHPVEVEVIAGIAPGESVALSSLGQLRDGTLVSPRLQDAGAGSDMVVRRPSGDAEASLPPVSGDGG